MMLVVVMMMMMMMGADFLDEREGGNLKDRVTCTVMYPIEAAC